MKIPAFFKRFVSSHPRLLAVIAATPALPVGSYLLPFWHDCESILAILYLFSVLVVVDVKVEEGRLADGS